MDIEEKEKAYLQLQADIIENKRENDPELFSTYLKKLCEVAEPSEKPVEFLSRNSINDKYAKAWLEGSIHKPALRPQMMAEIIFIFVIVYPILTNPAAIESFISMASTEILKQIGSDPLYMTILAYIKCKYSSPQVDESDYPELNASYLIRRKCYDDIWRYVTCGQYKIVIVEGIRGSGKTTVLKLLLSDQLIRHKFENRIFYLSMQKDLIELELRRWLSELRDEPLDNKRPIDEVKKDIRKELAEKKCLILLDDAESFDPWVRNEYFELTDPNSESVYVVATFPLDFDRSLPAGVTEVGIDRISSEELKELYRKLRSKVITAEEMRELNSISEILSGNIAAIVMCLRMDSSLSEIRNQLEDLRISSHDLVDPVYRPLEMAYKYFSLDMREFYEKLSRLPFCREYDEEAVAVAVYGTKKEWKAALYHLKELSRRVQIIVSGDHRVFISKYVLKHSKAIMAKKDLSYNDEKEIMTFLETYESQKFRFDILSESINRLEKIIRNITQLPKYLRNIVGNFPQGISRLRSLLVQYWERLQSRQETYKVREKLLSRFLSWVFNPNYVTELKTIQKYSTRFHILDYTHAHHYAKRKRYFFWSLWIALIMSVISRKRKSIGLSLMVNLLSITNIYFLLRDEMTWNSIFSKASKK